MKLSAYIPSGVELGVNGKKSKIAEKDDTIVATLTLYRCVE
ncbi:MAG: hypothetical protein AB4041_12210 [Microcystaceae cyanobacterium]